MSPELEAMLQILWGEGMGAKSSKLAHYIKTALTSDKSLVRRMFMKMSVRLLADNLLAWEGGSTQEAAVTKMLLEYEQANV